MRTVGKKHGYVMVAESVTELKRLLLQVQPGMTVYDPFCGIGISTLKIGGDASLFMQDMDMQITALAAANVVINNIKPEVIRTADSYLDPISDVKFDRITSFPPIGQKWSQNYMNDVCRENHLTYPIATPETVAIEQAVYQLKYDGVALVQVPLSFLFKGGRTEHFRTWMIMDKFIDCVIELPQRTISNTAMATALVVLKKGQTTKDILLIEATSLWHRMPREEGYFSDEDINRIVSVYQERKDSDISILVDRETIVENESKLTLKSYKKEKVIIEIEDVRGLKEREKMVAKRYAEVIGNLYKIREGKNA